MSNEIKEQRESKSTKELPNLTTQNKKKGSGAHLDVAGHCLREGSRPGERHSGDADAFPLAATGGHRHRCSARFGAEKEGDRIKEKE